MTVRQPPSYYPSSRTCDVLLIQPPIRDYYLTTKRTLPSGLASIAAVLRQNSFRTAILDGLASGKSRSAPLPPPLEYLANVYAPVDISPFALFHSYRHFGNALSTIAERARLCGAFLIGISSLFSAYEDMALETAKAVKGACPEAIIAIGGHHPTAFPDRILNHPSVDIVLRGDGEASMPVLAGVLRQNSDLTLVPGIAFDRDDGTRYIAPPAYVEHLAQLPPPAIDLVSNSFYGRRKKATLVITTSRGCPLQCSYCCMGAQSEVPYRRRSVEHVLQEIAHASRNNDIGLIDFEDENIALDRFWFTELLHGIIRHFKDCPPELRAMNGLFPPTLDQPTTALMKTAGFRSLNLSLGTRDPALARTFMRPDVTPAFDRVLDWAEELNMTVVGYLIVGAPQQDLMTSVNDLLYLAPRRVLAGLSVYYPAPDSLDFKKCTRSGNLPASPLRWRSTALPLCPPDQRVALMTLLRLGRILNFMKSLLDGEEHLPDPQPIPATVTRLTGTRREKGRQLLHWFFDDGVIRGVLPDGGIIEHPTDKRLTGSFLKGLSGITVRGVQQRN